MIIDGGGRGGQVGCGTTVMFGDPPAWWGFQAFALFRCVVTV